MSDGESAQPVRKSRRWILITLLAVLVAGGGGVVAAAAYFYKENITQIDRRYQTVVVREYVDAVLVRRDDGRASLFACEGQAALEPFLELREAIKADEARFGVSTLVVVGVMTTEGSVVRAELQLSQQSGGASSQELQYWQFAMTEDDGWRVCGAQRLPDLTPSLSPSQPSRPSSAA